MKESHLENKIKSCNGFYQLKHQLKFEGNSFVELMKECTIIKYKKGEEPSCKYAGKRITMQYKDKTVDCYLCTRD